MSDSQVSETLFFSSSSSHFTFFLATWTTCLQVWRCFRLLIYNIILLYTSNIHILSLLFLLPPFRPFVMSKGCLLLLVNMGFPYSILLSLSPLQLIFSMKWRHQTLSGTVKDRRRKGGDNLGVSFPVFSSYFPQRRKQKKGLQANKGRRKGLETKGQENWVKEGGGGSERSLNDPSWIPLGTKTLLEGKLKGNRLKELLYLQLTLTLPYTTVIPLTQATSDKSLVWLATQLIIPP